MTALGVLKQNPRRLGIALMCTILLSGCTGSDDPDDNSPNSTTGTSVVSSYPESAGDRSLPGLSLEVAEAVAASGFPDPVRSSDDFPARPNTTKFRVQNAAGVSAPTAVASDNSVANIEYTSRDGYPGVFGFWCSDVESAGSQTIVFDVCLNLAITGSDPVVVRTWWNGLAGKASELPAEFVYQGVVWSASEAEGSVRLGVSTAEPGTPDSPIPDETVSVGATPSERDG